MATTPVTGVRVDPELIEAVADRYGLTDRRGGSVIRYALALAAGLPDPIRATHVQRGGYRPRTREVAMT